MYNNIVNNIVTKVYISRSLKFAHLKFAHQNDFVYDFIILCDYIIIW